MGMQKDVEAAAAKMNAAMLPDGSAPTRRDQRMARMMAVSVMLSAGGLSGSPLYESPPYKPPARHPWKPKGRNQRIRRV